MAVDITATAASHLEVVNKNVQKYFEMTSEIAGEIKKTSEVATISRYLYRYIAKLWNGGTVSKVSLNDADLGQGSGPKYVSFQAGYITTDRKHRVSFEQIEASRDSAQAVVNVLNDVTSSIIDESLIDDDLWLHTDGTGKLTNAASTGTATTLTFAGASDTLGIDRLRPGMWVDVWSSDGATKRAGGPYQITAIDEDNKIVTFGSAPTGMQTTDLIAFHGLDVYGPSTLTSFTSTWPGASLTSTSGLTGDSGRHGIYYANDATSANYYLGKQKSAIPQLLPSHITANAALTFQHGWAVLDKLRKKRTGDEAVQGLLGVFPMSQRAQHFSIGTALVNNMISAGSALGKATDLTPSNMGYTQEFEFCGVRCRLSKRQDKARVDFINPSKWGRAQLHEPKFVDYNGSKFQQTRAASTGNLNSALELHFLTSYDFVCFDPGAGAYIDALAVQGLYQ